jgi:hypothetical protein
MLNFDTDPARAENQMQAVIFLLTIFGYIDGDFDQRERSFVREQIIRIVRSRVESAVSIPAIREELVAKYSRHFEEVFEVINSRVQSLLNEPVSKDDPPGAFVEARLKQQCFELLSGFGPEDQEALLGIIDELLMADGEVHPAEVKFRGELASLLEAELELEQLDGGQERQPLRIEGPRALTATPLEHPFFSPFESHYSRSREELQKQLADDEALIERALATLAELRRRGQGRLDEMRTVADLALEGPFLDGHVYWIPGNNGLRYELLVLGDLHGCYSILKSAVLQSQFFDKVDAWRADPTRHPKPLLVLLGDYIDRGLFSLNGVLRTVLQLFVTAPEHVFPLRGNHEYYVEHEGKVYGGVSPAESINSLKGHVPMDTFRRFRNLFEALPSMLLFGQTLFVHGGIPRDRDLRAKWRGLSTLNDPDLRFQMMWSDPARVDVIPADLQDKTARFAFGKLQFRAFMERIGCHTLIRGHEKVLGGFERAYEGPEGTLLTLFSSGGFDNDDLPEQSAYRNVRPMVLTMEVSTDGTTLRPWTPDYRAYNHPDYNGFFRSPPEFEHRA